MVKSGLQRRRSSLIASLFLVVFQCGVYSAHGQDGVRVAVPATRITIIPPPCYKLLGQKQTFFCPETGATLTIIETMARPEEVFARYSDSSRLAEEDFEVISRPERITIDGVPGMKFNLGRRSGLLTNRMDILRIFVSGDSLGTFTAVVAYSDSLPALAVEPLVASISTIHWDHTRSLTPMDILSFSLTPPAGMKLAQGEARWQVYTPDGTSPDESSLSPRFILSTTPGPGSLEYFPEEGRQKLMESFIKNVHANVRVSRTVEFNKTLLDGVPAFETVSSGRWTPDGRSVAVYFTILFHPGDLIMMVGLADAGDADRFINIFKETARSFRRHSPTVDEAGECGVILGSHRYTQAIACFDTALRQNPELLSARLGRAEALRLQGKHDQAIAEYTRVLEVDRYCEQALLGRARSLVAQDSCFAAIKDFNIALELNGADAAGYVERASARSKIYDFDGARSDYERAIALSPDSAGFYVALATVQPLEEALRTYAKAIELDKSNASAYKERGMRYFFVGKYEKAVADLSVAISLQSGDKELYSLRGAAYSGLGKTDAALRDMDQGLEDAPHLGSRGFLNGLNDRVSAGLRDLGRSIELDSTEWMSYFLRGIINYLNGSFRDACSDFRQACVRSVSAEARAWLFFSEAKVYRMDDARKNLDRYYSTGASKTEDWQKILQFLLGKIDEAGLIRSVEPYRDDGRHRTEKDRLADARCDMYFAIGMKNYTSGLKVGAKPFWRKCLETKRTTLVSYGVASALLRSGGQP